MKLFVSSLHAVRYESSGTRIFAAAGCSAVSETAEDFYLDSMEFLLLSAPAGDGWTGHTVEVTEADHVLDTIRQRIENGE